MTPLKVLKKIATLVRGGATPGQMFLGCLLGVLIGMIPGVNLTLLAAVVLLILLNANGGLAVLGFVVGKALCLLLAPVTFRIGYTIIHHLGLEGLFRAAGETPVVALMDLHYYCLIGGLPVALVAGVVLGLAVGWAVKGVRAGLAAAGGRSAAVQAVAGNFLVRFLLRLALGKQKGGMADMLAAKAPLLRKGGVILCVVLVGLVVAAELVFAGLFFRGTVTGALETAVGAEVNLASASLSAFTGRVALQGLEVTDPDAPANNLVQVADLTGDVSLAGLLTKRVVIDELKLDRLRTSVPRKSPGRVYRKPLPPPPPPAEDDLSQYFEQGRKLLEYLRKLKDYLDDRQDAQDRKKDEDERRPDQADEKRREHLRELAERRGYLALSADRVLAEHPPWVIRRLEIDGVVLKDVPGTHAVRGENLSGAPELLSEPMALSARTDGKPVGSLAFDFATPGGRHRLMLETPELPLAGLGLSERSGLNVSAGTARVRVADGLLSNRRIVRLPVGVKVRDLQAAAREGKGLLGLDAATSAEVLKHLTEIEFAAVLDGPVDRPRITLDEKGILTALKATLVKAGKAELARQADRQLQKVGARFSEKLGGQLGKTAGDSAGGILGKLIPGLGGKDDKKPPDKKPSPTTQPADLLKRLFK